MTKNDDAIDTMIYGVSFKNKEQKKQKKTERKKKLKEKREKKRKDIDTNFRSEERALWNIAITITSTRKTAA